MPKQKKAMDLARHAQRRALERFGIDYTREMRNALVGDIQTMRGEFLESKSNRISIWAVDYKDKTYAVVYDKIRREIVSFLPDHALRRYTRLKRD